jgi:LCP family protein required for cell wall assembly
VNALESALHPLADDGSTGPARPDLADRVLARARTRSRRRSALAAAGAAATVAVITIGLTVAGGAPEAHRSPPGPAASRSSATSTSPVLARARNNVLLIGSDAATDRIGVRPDTMILASIDTRTGTTTMFGFPRAMQRVPFPAGSGAARAFPHGFVCADQECLLNSIWTWAEDSGARYYPGDPHPGLTATTQAIEQVSGLSVNDTVVVDMTGLSKLIDAVGGVTVNVNRRLPIGGNADPSSSDYHRATSGWIEAGPKQHLDGYHALWFARSRWSSDDYDRMARQQCLVRALVQQVSPAELITAYPRIATALRDSLRTSIAVRDLPAWGELVSRMRDAPVRSVALDPQSGVDPAHPDFAAIRTRVRTALGADRGGGGSGTGTPSSPRC